MCASFLVSERYSSITSGTRRTPLDPIDDFEGGGGGGGAGADGPLFSFTSLNKVGGGGGLGVGVGSGALVGNNLAAVLSFVASDSVKSTFGFGFSVAGVCSNVL
ncbi:hypothetical protein FF1_029186 [Malus domestica]